MGLQAGCCKLQRDAHFDPLRLPLLAGLQRCRRCMVCIACVECTICSTCDVHTYIHIVKDARLAGIFYWSQTGHIFGQRPSYTNRETERTRVKDQDQDQSRLQVHASVVKITSERPIEKITSPIHIYDIKCLFKWEMVYKDISTSEWPQT